MPPGRKPTPAHQRVLQRTDTSGDCWLYLGATNGRGYGVVGVWVERANGRPWRNGYVHRVVYEAVKGPIPEGMEIAHSCDVRNCVRPEHLSLMTHRENEDDKLAKRRQSHGEHRWSAKLTEDDVREIRRRHSAGESAYSLAKAFNISSSSAENVVNRKRWRHVA